MNSCRVTIDVKGGLGNQLFQLYTVLTVAAQHHLSTVFFNSGPTVGEGMTTVRSTYWDTLFSTVHTERTVPARTQYRVIHEPGYHYSPVVVPEDHHANILYVLSGYYQSWKYVSSHRHQINRLLRIAERRNTLVAPPLDMCSVHIRLGDYKRLQHMYVLLTDTEYYERALSLLPSTITQILVCCDWSDEEDTAYVHDTWVPHMKERFPHLTFGWCPPGMADWQQLLYMSGCRHHIIANSTFSWWAAFLSEEPHTVWYPSRWFADADMQDRTGDLCPPAWTAVLV